LLRRKAQAAARDLIVMQTATATRIKADGTSEPVAPRDIAIGDQLLIVAGERLPVDAVVLSGEGEADFSLVTGESAPVAVKTGDVLRAGSLMLAHALNVRVSARVEDSLVAEVARLLEAGQQNRSRYVRLADKATALYVPLVHGAALSVFLGSLLFGLDLRAAATSAIALLIITCPCALGLAVPAVQIVATGRLFKRGLLVKSGDALERLAEADVAVFDKTGTITAGKPVLTNGDRVSRTALERAAQLARASKHPLARALAAAAGAGPVCANVREVVGDGLEGDVDGKRARLGRAAFVNTGDASGGASELWYRVGTDAPLRFSFADSLRRDAPQTIAALEQRGFEVELLSGDKAQPVSAAALASGISAWQAQTDPKAKVEHLGALAAKGHRTLMIGDGLNDAAALAVAHVSISLGTAADASQAAADMVLQGEDLAPIVEAIDVARAARRLVLQNFAFAALYNAVAVPLAALGLVTPLIAAVAMSASSLLVMANALRLSARG
jgi:P-type Cu2+ transporter